ncbi:MAG TPA: glucose-6-phosphate isomerase, partial [Gammaproteobacteria bacterium]|nr:glucose-6-phosphate isomerase [Gammaproteobacteria bacterium]
MLNTTGTTWKALQAHFEAFCEYPMRDLFAEDSERFSKFSLQYNTILLDYSKNRINEETMSLLFQLAREAGLEEWITRMFNGEKINHTENRAVLHTALRNRSTESVMLDGQDVMPEVRIELNKIRE